MRFRSLLGIVALLLAAGCSGMSVRHDFDPDVDFAKYRTYKWLLREKMPGVTVEIDKSIRQAVDRQMVGKGMWKSTGDDPDLLITYRVTLKDRVEVKERYYGDWRGIPGHRYVDIDEYQEGTLMIEFFDPVLEQLVWQGWAVGIVGDERQRDQRIGDATQKIFERYPPHKK